ncbi:SH3 domain-containing protein [Gymnodinialimonas ulvae]|uniref:SH3 domain-containing protein n=1 Tax=Gymnodinialimonas ulvae TaxID=3126504 RepID=UPI0030B6AA8C
MRNAIAGFVTLCFCALALAPSPTLAQTEAVLASTEATSAPERVGPVTGFAIPRYVSMRASEGNARRGPSRSHRIDWVFTRRHMPMMIVAEHGHWRRVVDRDGAGGWMHYSLLSGERSAIVEEDMLPLYARPDTASLVRAHAELGVTGRLRECQPDWCLMEVGGYRGWVQTAAIWGVDADESFD